MNEPAIERPQAPRGGRSSPICSWGSRACSAPPRWRSVSMPFLSPPAPPERDVEVAAIALEAIPDGGGTIVHLPGGHVALERAARRCSAFSAVCTHLGCVIQWQPTKDQAWYCPAITDATPVTAA